MFSTCRDPVRCSCHTIAEGHLTLHTTHLRGDFQACVVAGVGVVTVVVAVAVAVAVAVFVDVVVCDLACFFPSTCRFHADSDVTVTPQQICGKLITPDVMWDETAWHNTGAIGDAEENEDEGRDISRFETETNQ